MNHRDPEETQSHCQEKDNSILPEIEFKEKML